MLSTNVVKWLYRLDAHYAWESGWTIPEDKFFLDSSGVVRLIIERGGRVTVTEGYAWNGCSPKMPFLDLLIGTPDGAVYKPTGRPKAYFASLVHDALYQFLDAGSPISRRDADGAFLRLLQASEFRLAWIYWAAVRIGGWMVWKATDVKREWNGTGVRAES
jgi:uncharacterized protein DUF1353